VRHALEDAPGMEGKALPESYQDAVARAVERMEVDCSRRNILIAHQFVTGAGRCDSEDVSVGGVDNVDADLFDAFDYVALGHIHSPQHMKRETVRYCGTPLKYSFSEAEQEKSVTVVELGEKGRIEITAVPLVPLHDLRRIRGTYLEVTARDFYRDMDTEDYVQITLTDEEDIPDGMEKLRIIYPNLMRLEYDNSRTRQNRLIERTEEIEQKSELELFAEFYELQNNQPMSDEQAAFVARLIEECR
ncbi:MAG: exonuclease SbcCD subunit D C-terminal domain-containing protein, partial [Lachnospiraceae bacterium]|nr:exonuclease SbcCD subunit D C-terminal domain-containing protein [Lachnospiraceae bacterium]